MYTVHSLIGVREAEEKVKFEMLEFIHNCLIFILHENNWGVNNNIIALVGECFSNPWYVVNNAYSFLSVW